MPVTIAVQKRSARLPFVLDLVFTRMMGLQTRVVDEPDAAEGSPTIYYGSSASKDELVIPDSGLIWDRGCSFSSPVVDVQGGLPKLLFNNQFDLFSAVFWMVAEYENYQAPSVDQHNRYLLSDLHQLLGLETQPIVHLWVAELEAQLITRWPELIDEQQKPTYQHQLTFDLDHPWKYLHKPLWVQMGGLAKATINFRPEEVKERLNALLTGKDPHDTLDQIFSVCPPEFTSFFILLENLHVNDSRFTWRHKRWRKRIKEIISKGYSVGIHPSYLAMEKSGQIHREKTYLEEIIGAPTTKTRMHFLRYKLPSTRREMIQAGIREDFTPYLNGTGGFPNGMMIPYPWFDLKKNVETTLTMVPTILMDRTIVGTPGFPKYHDQLTPTREFLSLLTTIIDGNGSFVLCLHNECLSESGEWKSWSRWFAEIIRILKEKNTVGKS